MNKDTFLLMNKDLSPFTYWKSYATKKEYQLIEINNDTEKCVMKCMETNQTFNLMKYDLVTRYEEITYGK